MIKVYSAPAMPLKGLYQLRVNIEAFLRDRHITQKTLAMVINKDPSVINKFLKGLRELQLEDLDRIAAFLDQQTYQLFTPGASKESERRVRERRAGKERRRSHSLRAAQDLGTTIDNARAHGRQVSDAPPPPQVVSILADAERRIAAFYRDQSRRQTAPARTPRTRKGA